MLICGWSSTLTFATLYITTEIALRKKSKDIVEKDKLLKMQGDEIFRLREMCAKLDEQVKT